MSCGCGNSSGNNPNVHIKSCPEYQDTSDNKVCTCFGYPHSKSCKARKDFYVPEYMYGYAAQPEAKCECGSESIGGLNHSSWCSKHKGK